MNHRETVKYPFRANRRTVLKSATGAAAAMGAAGILGKSYTRALAQDSVRDQILQIPGPGLNPTDADMEKVGELCLTTENQGKFAGQTVRFQGLSNAGYHNNVFRPLSRAWEEATGAKIEWIDVTQADSYPKMAEAISSNAVDFDVLEGSGGWEGELLGGGFCVPMPDSIRNDPVYDFDDIVAYLQSPTRTWDGVVYGASVDGDMHHFNYRSDVFSDPGFAEEWTANGGEGDWGPPATWQQVQAASEFLSGKQLDDQSIGAAIATQQAISQRDAQWAGEYTVFATIVRPMMTFLEGFTFAVTPIMGFLVAMGTFGINVAAKYVVTLLWIQLWMPTMAIVNLYLNLVINKKMAAFQAVGGMGLPIPSFGGLYELNSQIQHWLSTGGMLASSVPALTMMLVYGGSAVAATHFARRMEGGDHLDEKIMRPNVMSNGPALAVGAMSDMDRVSGLRLHGAEAAMPSLRIGDNREASLSSSRSAFEAAQASFRSELGRVASRAEGLNTALRSGEAFGRKVSSSTSESDQALHAFANEIGNRVNLSDGQKAALTSALAGSVDASGKLGGVGGKGGGVGGELSAMLRSVFDSDTASSIERALGDSEKSGRTAQFNSDYGVALARDITAGRETAVTSLLSDSESSALNKSAQDVVAQERRTQETAQRSQSIGTGQDVKLSTLGNQGASMAPELAQRLAGMDPALHGEAQRLAGFYQSRYGMQPEAAFFAGGMMALDRAAARGDSGANDMLVGFASRALGSDAGHQTGNAGANADLFAGAPQFGATRQQVDAAGLAPVASGAAARDAAAGRIQGTLAGADQAINDHRANGADAAAQQAAQWGRALDERRATEIEGDMLKWVESKTGMAQTVGEAAWGTMKTTDDALKYTDQGIRGAIQGLLHGQGMSAGVSEVMTGYHDAHQRYAMAELGMTQTQAKYWADVQMAPLERAVGTLPGGDAALSSFDTRAQASRAAVINEAGGESGGADALRSSAATGSEVNAKMVGSWNRAAGLLQ